MKISPLPATGMPTPQATQADNAARGLDARRITMQTNFSTDRDLTPPPAPEKMSISDATEQTDAANEETKPLSPQFAALARQKRALQVKEREILEREQALEAKSSQSTDGTAILARLKQDPLSVLQEANVTYDELSQAILMSQSGVNPKLSALEQKLKDLEQGIDSKFTDRDAMAEKQVLAQIKGEIDTLTSDGDTYEMVRATGSQELVLKLIHETFKKTGEVLGTAEALEAVEEELLNENLKLANLKKIQSRLNPVQPTEQQSPQMRTLTNRDSATPAVSRRQRALAAFTRQTT